MNSDLLDLYKKENKRLSDKVWELLGRNIQLESAADMAIKSLSEWAKLTGYGEQYNIDMGIIAALKEAVNAGQDEEIS